MVRSRSSASPPVPVRVMRDVVALDQRLDAELLGLVVLDDQQLAHARLDEGLDALEYVGEALAGGRLGHERERAALQAVLALLFHGEHLHGDVARLRIVLQVVEHGPAQHVGQEYIERDGRQLELVRQRQRLGAVVRHQRLESLLVRRLEQHARVGDVVLDDEHRALALLQRLAIVRHALDRLRGQHRSRLDGCPAERLGRAAAVGRALVGQR